MSFAFSAIVLFILFLPGIAFRRFYFSEEFSNEYYKESFFAVFVSTIVPSLIFQALWLNLAYSLYGLQYFGFWESLESLETNELIFKAYCVEVSPSFKLLGGLVSGSPTQDSFASLQKYLSWVSLYHGSMVLFSGIVGYVGRKLVRFYKLDRRYKIFRYRNFWHYFLRGEFYDFPRAEIQLTENSTEDIDFRFVDIVVNIGGQQYLYDGILVDYELSKDGGLDTISLTDTKRRKLTDDGIDENGQIIDNSSKYYEVKGHVVLFKYSEISNINMTYWRLDTTGRPHMIV